MFDTKTPSIIAEVLQEIWEEIAKLIDSRIIVTQGVTLYHNDCELEYIVHLNLGPTISRKDRIEKVVASFSHLTWTIHEVVKIWGTGLLNGEDLRKLGIIQEKGTEASVNLGLLVRNVQSESVIIGIRKKIPIELRNAIVSLTISQNAMLIGKDKEVRFSVSLDYANMWKDVFQSFSVKDVHFGYGMEIVEGSLEDELPGSMKSKIKKASVALTKGDQRAIRYFNTMSKEFLSFESDRTIQKLRGTVKVEPPDRVELIDVTPKMQSFQIAGTDFPITIPGKANFRFRTGIEENEVVLRGRFVFEQAKYHEVISEILALIESKTREFRFS